MNKSSFSDSPDARVPLTFGNRNGRMQTLLVVTTARAALKEQPDDDCSDGTIDVPAYFLLLSPHCRVYHSVCHHTLTICLPKRMWQFESMPTLIKYRAMWRRCRHQRGGRNAVSNFLVKETVSRRQARIADGQSRTT